MVKCLVILLMICCGVFSKTIYVDSTSITESPDGHTWSTAYRHLQDALRKVKKDDSIKIASGTYYTSYSGDKTGYFMIPPNVTVVGSYVSGSEKRLIDSTRTILSADIAYDDIVTTDTIINNENNGYRVLVCENGINVVLDGLVIQGGYGIDNSDLSKNYSGSGMYMIAWNNDNTAKIDMINCIVQLNTCTGDGAGVYFKGNKINIENSTITKNRVIAKGRKNFSGGGIGIDAYTAYISKCIVSKNMAQEGGGISFNGINCTLIDTKCLENRSVGGGGAIKFTGNNMIVQNDMFEKNVAVNGIGGVLEFKGKSLKIIKTNASFNNSYGSGGVLDFQGDSCLVMSSVFNNNSTHSCGGVFRVLGKLAKFDSCTFTNNSAKTQHGGVFYCEGDSLTIKSSAFKKNTAETGNGGVLYYLGKQATVVDNDFTENRSLFGGAIYAEQDIYRSLNCVDIHDCNFNDNSAEKSGNAVCFYGNAKIGNCTFTSLETVQKNVVDNKVHKIGEKVRYIKIVTAIDSIQNELELKASRNNTIKDCVFVNRNKGKNGVIVWYGTNTGCTFTQQRNSLQ